MRKYILKIIVLILFIVLAYLIYRSVSMNIIVNNTINNESKINYDTNIILNMSNKNYSSKIEYKIKKYMNIKNIVINNYVNDELNNNILEYIVKNDDNYNTYVYNGTDYDERLDEINTFNVDYKKLKDSIINIKSKKGNTYVVKMKSYDAYNLIYTDEVMKKEDLNKNIDVYITIDKENDFIKEISYKINNINNEKDKDKMLNYEVLITNFNINNKDVIKLPF